MFNISETGHSAIIDNYDKKRTYERVYEEYMKYVQTTEVKDFIFYSEKLTIFPDFNINTVAMAQYFYLLQGFTLTEFSKSSKSSMVSNPIRCFISSNAFLNCSVSCASCVVRIVFHICKH